MKNKFYRGYKVSSMSKGIGGIHLKLQVTPGQPRAKLIVSQEDWNKHGQEVELAPGEKPAPRVQVPVTPYDDWRSAVLAEFHVRTGVLWSPTIAGGEAALKRLARMAGGTPAAATAVQVLIEEYGLA